jgi:hypothetical protein
MKWNKLYEYPKSMRSLINDARHYEVGEEKLPSVTTILAATASDEKRASLDKWKDRFIRLEDGTMINEAERVKNTAANRGTAMHSVLESHIEGQGMLDLTDLGQEAHKMANTIIDKGLGDLSEIWGSEVTLYYPGLYAGATDLCGIYMERESIIDFKQTNKPKRDEWIEDYKLQMAAYAMAHNYVYGTGIEQGVILMCPPAAKPGDVDLFFQSVLLLMDRSLETGRASGLRRVDKYYELKKKRI